MSNGMGTALYTTLTGLVCSVLSAMQYHMIDRHADELIELTLHTTQIHVIPKINNISPPLRTSKSLQIINFIQKVSLILTLFNLQNGKTTTQSILT